MINDEKNDDMELMKAALHRDGYLMVPKVLSADVVGSMKSVLGDVVNAGRRGL
jgi:hypothetical protein